MYCRRAPKRIGLTHSSDQRSDLWIDFRTTSVAAPPTPIVSEPLSVPANDSVRLNDVKWGMPT
jgi:hypothetical protein